MLPIHDVIDALKAALSERTSAVLVAPPGAGKTTVVPLALMDEPWVAGRKLIVYFYPAAMTPGCTKQACDFSESLESLQKDGYEVVVISKDKPVKLAKFRERDALTLRLLSDEGLDVHRALAAES